MRDLSVLGLFSLNVIGGNFSQKDDPPYHVIKHREEYICINVYVSLFLNVPFSVWLSYFEA